MTIDNAFDKVSPFIGAGIGPGASDVGNTVPMVFPMIGRRFAVTAQANF